MIKKNIANAIELPDRRLMLPGGMQDTFPFDNIPAVLISNTDRVEDGWRLVPVTDSPTLPDGSQLVYAQVSAILNGNTLYLFCRNDQRKVPLVFVSHDFGETWEGPYSHDIPSVRSKFCSGTLSDGRNYIIANTNPHTEGYDHSKMSLFLSKKDSMEFDRELVLFGKDAACQIPAAICYEPCAIESDGKLHVIACVGSKDGDRRGIYDFILDISKL